MASGNFQEESSDEIVSHFGSISGGTFVSRRSRRAGSTLNTSKVDQLASNLRDFDFDAKGAREKQIGRLDSTCSASERRLNTSFHHFRFLVVMFAGMSVGLMMLLRYNMTISILKMVNQTHLYLVEHPEKTVEEFLAEGHSLGGEFNWNNEMVATILSWYMFSYTLPQVPAARLAIRLGCRLAMPLSLAVCALATLLTPMAARLDWRCVVAMRLLNGLGASAVQPMLLHVVENWMRYDEISLGLSISQTLNTIFITLTPIITGYLAAIHWSYSFYVPALVTLAFCLLWSVLIADGPESSRYLSANELEHIMRSEEPESSPRKPSSATQEEDEQIYRPDFWLAILRVPSFYAHIVMWCLCSSSYSGFVFVFPAYMQQFLHLSVAQTGLVCSLIQLGSVLSVLWPHPLLRWLQRRGLSVTVSRIIGQSICCFMVASTWIYVGLFHEHQSQVLFLNRCFQGGSDVIVVGALMSNYARAGLSSLAFAIVNTVGHLSIVGASSLIGWLLDYTGQSRTGWTWIYLGLGLSEVFMWLTFTFFIHSEPVRFRRTAQPASCQAEEATGAEQPGLKSSSA